MSAIYVTLEFPHFETIEAELRKCKRLEESLSKASLHQGNKHLNVTDIVIQQDRYGHALTGAISTEDSDLWAFCGDVPVLWEDDLEIPQGGGYLGIWNMNFLRWLKVIAQKTRAKISISYVHERGDFLYETADWVFDPSSPDVEIFNLSTYVDDEWSRTAIRKANGSVMVEADG